MNAAANDTAGTVVTGFFLAMSGICVVAVYWLPVIIAWRRHLLNRSQILVVTLLLGWTFVGWVVALVMSLQPVPPPGYPLPPPYPNRGQM